jgi:hypothetical protein
MVELFDYYSLLSPFLQKPSLLLDASRPLLGMCRPKRSTQERRQQGKRASEGRESRRGARELKRL